MGIKALVESLLCTCAESSGRGAEGEVGGCVCEIALQNPEGDNGKRRRGPRKPDRSGTERKGFNYTRRHILVTISHHTPRLARVASGLALCSGPVPWPNVDPGSVSNFFSEWDLFLILSCPLPYLDASLLRMLCVTMHGVGTLDFSR